MWPFSNSSLTSEKNQTDPLGCPVKNDKFNQNNTTVNIQQNTHIPQLPTDRVISSIPRYQAQVSTISSNSNQTKSNQDTTQSVCPVNHSTSIKNESNTDEIANQQNWVYPSPSQFYNALKRKNRNPRAEDMYTVVPIHNAVNERVWSQVLEWEANYGKGAFDHWPRSGKSGPMLCSFRGRPNDLSPRAWIKVLSGYQAPFDRHDWEVIRPTEQRMRYVVDFYPGRGADSNSTNHQQVDLKEARVGAVPNLAFYLDVRPALDSWEGLRMRFLHATDQLINTFSSSSSSPSDTTLPQSFEKKP